MHRTCPRPSQQALITYSCLLTCFIVGSGSSVDHASGQQLEHSYSYGGVNCWRCAGFTYYYGERVSGQLLPNNTSMLKCIARILILFAIALVVYNIMYVMKQEKTDAYRRNRVKIEIM